jgi:hypothetical protein
MMECCGRGSENPPPCACNLSFNWASAWWVVGVGIAKLKVVRGDVIIGDLSLNIKHWHVGGGSGGRALTETIERAWPTPPACLA